MKKLFITYLLGCLALINNVWGKEPGCRELVVNVENASPYHCLLTDYAILSGKIFKEMQIPDQLPQGESMTVVLTQEFKNTAMLYLNYQCGEEHIMLLSNKPFFDSLIMFQTPPTTGYVLSQNKTAAIYKQKPPTMCQVWYDTPPAEITWTLLG